MKAYKHEHWQSMNELNADRATPFKVVHGGLKLFRRDLKESQQNREKRMTSTSVGKCGMQLNCDYEVARQPTPVGNLLQVDSRESVGLHDD